MQNFGIEKSSEVAEIVAERAINGLQTSILGVPGMGKKRMVSRVHEYSSEKYPDLINITLYLSRLVEKTPLEFYQYLFLQIKYVTEQEGIKIPRAYINLDINQFNAFQSAFTVVEILQHLASQGKKIAITIEGISQMNAPKSFFESLASLHFIKRGKVGFIFVDTPELTKKASPERHGILYESLIGSIIWLHPPSREYFKQQVLFWQDKFNFEVPLALQNFIWQQTGGIPSLTKHMIFYFSENANADYDTSSLMRYYTINSKLEYLLSVLSAEERNALRSIANKSYTPNLGDRTLLQNLQTYGLVTGEDNDINLTIGLLEDFLLRSETGDLPTDAQSFSIKPSVEDITSSQIKIQGNRVLVEGEPLENELTKREFRVLDYLLRHRSQVISREQIGRLIWGNKFDEKYSDWSLDQTISRLRKKLGDNGYQPTHIKTIRGRGFSID